MADKVIPSCLTELYNECGMNASAAAAQIGVSTSTVTQALRTKEATPRLELKALQTLERLRAERKAQAIQSAAPTQYLVAIPSAKIEAFKKVSSAMGLELVAL